MKTISGLCLPDSASHERKKILGAFGAELVITAGDEGTDGAIRKVKEMVAADMVIVKEEAQRFSRDD